MRNEKNIVAIQAIKLSDYSIQSYKLSINFCGKCCGLNIPQIFSFGSGLIFITSAI